MWAGYDATCGRAWAKHAYKQNGQFEATLERCTCMPKAYSRHGILVLGVDNNVQVVWGLWVVSMVC